MEGRSRREAERHFGIARKTVEKMCSFSAPLGYRCSTAPARPKLDGFTGVIDQDTGGRSVDASEAGHAEMDQHLVSNGAGNGRNGYGRKTVVTDSGSVSC